MKRNNSLERNLPSTWTESEFIRNIRSALLKMNNDTHIVGHSTRQLAWILQKHPCLKDKIRPGPSKLKDTTAKCNT